MNEKEYLLAVIQKMVIESSNVKHLAKILEAIIINGDGNISAASIATLSGVLTRNACALSNHISNFSLKLERAIDE